MTMNAVVGSAPDLDQYQDGYVAGWHEATDTVFDWYASGDGNRWFEAGRDDGLALRYGDPLDVLYRIQAGEISVEV